MVKLILTLSISGGLFALALFALKPFMGNRLSKSFQYYIWIVVLLRFILPFSFGINLMDFTFAAPDAPPAAEETLIPAGNSANPPNINPAAGNNAANNINPDIAGQPLQAPVTTDSAKPFDLVKTLTDNLLWIWLAGALVSLAFNILGYWRFMRYIHGGAAAVEMPDCCAAVYKSRFAPTPMLVGVIRPRIYLPDIEYTEIQLDNILRHELTHLRRRDVWLKWFVALVVSSHWFNPIVYFMRREISRACELSCDEAIIRSLDGAAKQSYGDTLISVVSESRYPSGVMSTTMCEEKKKLTERLVAIMNYKKKTKITVVITAVLAVVITGSALAFGASVEANTDKIMPSEGDVLTSGYTNEKIPDTEYSIPLADLRRLAAKGDELIFEDFSGYEGKDVGSGLYIQYFKVEGGYALHVGGGAVTGKPMYATLSITGIEENIDIRYDNIDEFISKYPVPDELNAQIYGYLDTIMSSPPQASTTDDYIKAHQAEYDAIVDMGMPALPMLRAILESGGHSLQDSIAALLVQDIVAAQQGKPHSEWYDNALKAAMSDVEHWSQDKIISENAGAVYYSAQNSRAYEMFQKNIFANLADDWTAEIGGIENPVWNYKTFAQYQILDHNFLSVSRHEELYYCTFSADNNKFGYIVLAYDGSSLQKISAAETPYLYDFRTILDEITDKVNEAGLDLLSAAASRVKLVDTTRNRSDEVILFTDDGGDHYIYYLDASRLIKASDPK